MSIGANNMGFGKIVETCIAMKNCVPLSALTGWYTLTAVDDGTTSGPLSTLLISSTLCRKYPSSFIVTAFGRISRASLNAAP